MRQRLRGAILCLLAVGLLTAAPAYAQPDATSRKAARLLAEEGLALYDRKEFEKALAQLDKADALLTVPTVDLYAARCLAELGRLTEAAARYLEVIEVKLDDAAPPAFKTAIEDAQRERAALLPRVPTVAIVVEGGPEGATVVLDGLPIPPGAVGDKHLVDPGNHRVEAKRDGASAVEEFSIKEGESTSITLNLPKPAQPPPPPPPFVPDQKPGGGVLRTLGWVSVGAGGVGLALWGVTGGIALAQRGRFENRGCDLDEDRCPAGVRTDGYQALRLTATIGFWSGIGLATAGTVLLIASPSPKTSNARPAEPGAAPRAKGPQITPWIGVASAGVSGAF
jgi:hypothetical protein